MMATEHVCPDCTLDPDTQARINRVALLRSNAAGHRRCTELDDAAADAINADLNAER